MEGLLDARSNGWAGPGQAMHGSVARSSVTPVCPFLTPLASLRGGGGSSMNNGRRHLGSGDEEPSGKGNEGTPSLSGEWGGGN